MEIVKLKGMTQKLGFDIVFGEENDVLYFSNSQVVGASSLLNALKGCRSDETNGLDITSNQNNTDNLKANTKGLAVSVSQFDIKYLQSLNEKNLKESLEILSYCELVLFCNYNGEIIEKLIKINPHCKICNTKKNINSSAYDLSNFIEGKLNSVEIVHGVLLDVFGVGVMLIGESGTGKSEIALELIGRGHLLVADDAVALRREANSLIGCSPAITRHLMDIRGIGIIDIRQMYGAGAVKLEQALELVIKLEPYDELKDYRVAGEFNLSGVSVPMLTLPLRFGRNMAVLTEAGARNLRLKAMGYSAENELSERIKNGRR